MEIDPARIRQIAANIEGQLLDLTKLTEEDTAGEILRVRQGDDLQAALDAAPRGSRVRVQPGTYKGNFRLKAKDGTGAVRVEPDVDPGNLESSKPWITEDHADALIRLESADGFGPTLAADDAGSGGWDFVGLHLAPIRYDRDQVTLGYYGATSLDRVPVGFSFDRCLFTGDPTPGKGQHRGIAAQCIGLNVRRSMFRHFFEVGRDSQCIAGWNGPGPFTIEDCFLEASGENVMFGGATAKIPNLVPSQVRILRNYFTKNPDWKNHPTPPGVKNLLEFKSVRDCLVEGNLFEHSWRHAQAGYCFMFTPSNPDNAGLNPWVTIENLVVQFNVIRKVGALLNVNNGQGAGGTQGTKRVTFRQNLAYDVNQTHLGDGGRMILMGNGPDQVVVDHNTMIGDELPNSWLALYGTQGDFLGFQVTNNVAKEGHYGLFTSNGVGLRGFQYHAPDGNLKGNVIEKGGQRTIDYGPDTLKVEGGQLAQQLDSSFRWRPGSAGSQHPTTDGKAPGVDVDQLLAKVGHLL